MFSVNESERRDPMASTTESTALPTGCYKCGRPGHWGRDCPSNPGGRPGDGPPSTVGGFSRASGGNFSNSGGFDGGNSWRGGKSFQGANSQGSRSAPKEVVKKELRKRPKLSADLLLSENGLGYVLEKMPEFVSIKGREDTVVRDLKSLLEGYMHWHSLLLPYFGFDQFVEKVEKAGALKRVRMCTRELRDKIAYGKGSADDKDVEADGSGGSSPRTTLPKETPGVPESADGHGISPPDDVFTADEPEIPLNEDDFEDFFRQGVIESSATVGGGGRAPPGLQRDASPVRKFPTLEDDSSTTPVATSATTVTISEVAAARMEANRLQALERAKARRAMMKTGQ